MSLSPTAPPPDDLPSCPCDLGMTWDGGGLACPQEGAHLWEGSCRQCPSWTQCTARVRKSLRAERPIHLSTVLASGGAGGREVAEGCQSFQAVMETQ